MKKKQNSTTPQAGGEGLRRSLSPLHVWAIAFGCVIGWGSFINPGKKFLSTSGAAGTAIAMILGALVMIVIAFSYAYRRRDIKHFRQLVAITEFCRVVIVIVGRMSVTVAVVVLSSFIIVIVVQTPRVRGVLAGEVTSDSERQCIARSQPASEIGIASPGETVRLAA